MALILAMILMANQIIRLQKNSSLIPLFNQIYRHIKLKIKRPTYAAAAPKISCLRALVKKLSTALNARVNSNSTPIIMVVFGPDEFGDSSERCQSA